MGKTEEHGSIVIIDKIPNMSMSVMAATSTFLQNMRLFVFFTGFSPNTSEPSVSSIPLGYSASTQDKKLFVDNMHLFPGFQGTTPQEIQRMWISIYDKVRQIIKEDQEEKK